jgi:hypothetical protein
MIDRCVMLFVNNVEHNGIVQRVDISVRNYILLANFNLYYEANS